MAVLEAMYGVKPADRFGLSDVQLLQMVILADMLQVSHIAEQAVECMCSTRGESSRMSPELQEQLLELPAWPVCLQPAFNLLLRPRGQLNWLRRMSEAWVKMACLSTNSKLEDLQTAPGSEHMLKQLLARLQNLDEAWKYALMSDELLRLPLQAMQLLLAADDLKVSCVCVWAHCVYGFIHTAFLPLPLITQPCH